MCKKTVEKRVIVAGYAFDLTRDLQGCTTRCELVRQLRLLALAVAELPCTDISVEVKRGILSSGAKELVISVK